MSLAPIPLDEQARVESLRELWLLDTEPEERFDRVTRTAQRLFNVPIAVFGLVDSERVWFKSRIGLELVELSRGDAFCAHGILSDGIIEVEDASKDARFDRSPLVVGAPAVRFYAGIPVHSPERRRVGVLAIMDRVPRTMSPEDLKALADLGHGVEAEISATHVTTVDDVTGMLNHRGFHQFAEKLLKISARSKNALSLLFVDVLNLERAASVKEREVMLKRVGEMVNTTFRESDVLARVGPGRFCVLLPENSDHAGETAGARLQTAVRAWNLEPGQEVHLDIVVSGARFDPEKPASLDQLMTRAETSIQAMRAVRQVGRN